MAFLMNLLAHLLRNQTVGQGLLLEMMSRVAMKLTVAQGGKNFGNQPLSRGGGINFLGSTDFLGGGFMPQHFKKRPPKKSCSGPFTACIGSSRRINAGICVCLLPFTSFVRIYWPRRAIASPCVCVPGLPPTPVINFMMPV